MTNTEPVAGFQFDIDTGDGLSNLNVTGVGSTGSASDAGFTVSTNSSGLVLGFSFSGASIPAGSGVLCYVEAMFDGDAGTLFISSATMSDTMGSSLTVDLGTDYWVGDMEIYGCMDPTSLNYDETATFNNGTCESADEYYDCNDTCLIDTDGDGVCDELEVLGCQDSTACNYNSDATDSGSCSFPVDLY